LLPSQIEILLSIQQSLDEVIIQRPTSGVQLCLLQLLVVQLGLLKLLIVQLGLLKLLVV
jgi:hypothetical protein